MDMALYLVESVLNGTVKDQEQFEQTITGIQQHLDPKKTLGLLKFRSPGTFPEPFSFLKAGAGKK